jgi:hypothetical protein
MPLLSNQLDMAEFSDESTFQLEMTMSAVHVGIAGTNINCYPFFSDNLIESNLMFLSVQAQTSGRTSRYTSSCDVVNVTEQAERVRRRSRDDAGRLGAERVRRRSRDDAGRLWRRTYWMSSTQHCP